MAEPHGGGEESDEVEVLIFILVREHVREGDVRGTNEVRELV